MSDQQSPLKNQDTDTDLKNLSHEENAEKIIHKLSDHHQKFAELEDFKKVLVKDLFEEIKVGDQNINKLKVQNLDFILDLSLSVTVELGRSRIPIKDLLLLGQGSVIELDKAAGSPLDILVNHKLVARGEVVVINEKFGIKVTDIVNPIERIETLKSKNLII
jgi:flagellar motor switch protein FliN/FliY